MERERKRKRKREEKKKKQSVFLGLITGKYNTEWGGKII